MIRLFKKIKKKIKEYYPFLCTNQERGIKMVKIRKHWNYRCPNIFSYFKTVEKGKIEKLYIIWFVYILTSYEYRLIWKCYRI